MAGPPRLITLNIGSQTIGLAEFRVVHGRLALVNYRFRETPLDPETGQRRDAHLALHETAALLREMMHEMQVHHGQVNYAVPAQSVFARFVKLPALDAAKIDKVIAFEAQQNVPFIEPGRFFLRSIPLGGSAITAAIAREFNESFAAAETRKKRDGFVGLGGAYAEPADPNIARVSKIARSTMTRLHAELMRSVTHYRAQQQ